MTGYERDFIYKTIPSLTDAIDKLTGAIKENSNDNDFDTIKRILSSAGLPYTVRVEEDKMLILGQSKELGMNVTFEFALDKSLNDFYI